MTICYVVLWLNELTCIRIFKPLIYTKIMQSVLLGSFSQKRVQDVFMLAQIFSDKWLDHTSLVLESF